MKTYSKKTFRKKTNDTLFTAKKHWVVYLIPFLLIFAGIILVNQDNELLKFASIVTICLSTVYIIIKASVRLHLSDEHLFIETGVLPWTKKIHEVPIFEIYKINASKNKLGKFLNTGTLSTYKREDKSFYLQHSNISDPLYFSEQLNQRLQKLPAYNLNTAYELKENGLISEHDYNLLKLGHMTHKYLS